MSSQALTQAVLIHFSRPDRPGLTAGSTSVLAQYDVSMLDIGQAVVHETLALGMLVQVSADRSLADFKTALLERAHELGLQARFKVVPQNAIKHWLHGLHQHHFIITLLGRSI